MASSAAPPPSLPLLLAAAGAVAGTSAFHLPPSPLAAAAAAGRRRDRIVDGGGGGGSVVPPRPVLPRPSLPSSPLPPPSAPLLATKADDEFDAFDYADHWYPVSWAADVPLHQPIRATVFDVDYALAKVKTDDNNSSDDDEDEAYTFYAVEDACPHKRAALSEGRITDRGDPGRRYFQCSYHGWTFDGASGRCVEIPQATIGRRGARSRPPPPASDEGRTSSPPRKKRREDAAAVAVRVVQGMVWLHPSYTPLEALAALELGTLLPPPRIPELDLPGYRMTPAVRDFPIDWTVLIENVLDPDHGYFAHSSSATGKGFDLYTADGVDNPVNVTERFEGGTWNVSSAVNAVSKLAEYNRNVRSGSPPPAATRSEDEPPPRVATSTFVAPSLIYQGRRDDPASPSPFLTGFWIRPTGTGRSRFMAAAIAKAPVSIPRWMVHVNLNNFLDQDTFLLCGQNRAVLAREAEGYLRAADGEEAGGSVAGGSNDVRKSTYVYRSPTEPLPVRIGRFFDATLARAPHRREGALSWYARCGREGKLFEAWPRREDVLDRYEQHTKICPDSMDVVRRCEGTMRASKLVGLAVAFVKLLLRGPPPAPSAPTNLFVSGAPVPAAVRQLLSRSAWAASALAHRVCRGKAFYSVLALAFLSYSIAARIRKEFFFKVDEQLHREDIKHIADNWLDL
ncbi:hypothetical protein ACHAWF_016351 [Thalassiosira exigua]